MKKIGRFFLSSILLVAGVVHLVFPETFNPAIFWGHELLSNFVAGAVEIVLAILLWARPAIGGRFTALWLLILIPVHVYVSLKQVPMFGTSDPLILWGRTILQGPLIWWAWSLRRD